MTKILHKVILSSRVDRADAVDVAEKTIKYMLNKGVKELLLDETLKNRITVKNERIKYINVKDFSKHKADMMVIIGGDGSLLRALHYFEKTPPPVLGVRVGRYGFLMEVEPEHVSEALDEIFKGKARVIARPRIVMYVENKRLPPVLNDYVILAPRLKMVHVRVSKKSTRETILNAYADGLIVSPTAGSTAYSLSAGGPIIDEELKVVVVTPLNPMQLRARPVVLDIREKLTVEVVDRDSEVYSDGIFCCVIEEGSKANIEFWDEVLFYRLKRDYYSRLKRRDYV